MATSELGDDEYFCCQPRLISPDQPSELGCYVSAGEGVVGYVSIGRVRSDQTSTFLSGEWRSSTLSVLSSWIPKISIDRCHIFGGESQLIL